MSANLQNPKAIAAQLADAALLNQAPPLRLATTAAARLLVLFGADWDARVLSHYSRSGRYRFHEHGFDLFSFPSNARLMWFDVQRFVDGLVRRYAGRIDGVFTSNEQFGALAASLIAERLNLPGADPNALLRAQHKYEARLRLRDFAPHLCPRFELIPYAITRAEAQKLHYPLFVKPVKATFSVLAKRCDSPDELIEHLRFRPWEKHIIKRLIEPHNQAMRRFPQFTVHSRHLVVEEVVEGLQVNVDAFVHKGAFHLLGLADELMYPGTMAFMRFASPSHLGLAMQARIREASELVLRGLGLDHGFFNLEFFVRNDGSLQLIEVNPRLAAQLAQVHEWVGGIDTYELGFAMALGRPLPTARPAAFGAAASFVWRRFDAGACPRMPSTDDLAWLAREFPQARLELYPKSGNSLRREIKWLGSHRYAVLNMPGDDEADLRARHERVCRRFGWPAPW